MASSNSVRVDRRRIPSARRMPPDAEVRDEIIRRHGVSLDRGLPTYVDPVSGFSVFTADFLASKGACCESGCRHCPFCD